MALEATGRYKKYSTPPRKVDPKPRELEIYEGRTRKEEKPIFNPDNYTMSGNDLINTETGQKASPSEQKMYNEYKRNN